MCRCRHDRMVVAGVVRRDGQRGVQATQVAGEEWERGRDGQWGVQATQVAGEEWERVRRGGAGGRMLHVCKHLSEL